MDFKDVIKQLSERVEKVREKKIIVNNKNLAIVIR